MQGDNISTVGVFSTVGIHLVQWRIPSVQWEDNISTVEVAQYSQDNMTGFLQQFWC